MSSFSPLLNNLDAKDLAVRLFAILRLHELTGGEVIPDKLRQAAESETDPALKLYLSWLAHPDQSGSDNSLAELDNLLNQKPPDWPRVLRLLLQANKESAAPALDVLRKASLHNLPAGLLPILVGFYSRFGDSQDVALLESWCSHTNPAVTVLAVEGLSRIKPENLKSFLYPLLTSESAGVRSRAIRLLYRWHPQQAIYQLSEMLASEIIDERRAALAHAFFLPFDRIKNDLIRFMIRETEPALLVQAGQLLIINPDIEVATAVATVAVETIAEKAPVITSVLDQQCDFLAKINLIEDEPRVFAAGLISKARAASDERQIASLNAAIQNGLLQQQTASDLTQAATWLKAKFALDLPQPVLLEVVESLAIIEPEFLLPHLPALLRMRDIKLQTAGLAAMAKVVPAQAEKLLEQYLCSAMPTRRRTGIKVLARLDKTFAQPLLLRTLAVESDNELLELIQAQLNDPLPREALVQLLSDSSKAEPCAEKAAIIGSLCEKAGCRFSDIEQACKASSEFSNEKIMLGRAEKQVNLLPAAQKATADRELSATPAKSSQKIIAQYQACRPAARLALIIGNINKNIIDVDELSDLSQEESGELQLFALQAAEKSVELRRKRGFSPVQTLKQSLNNEVTQWSEIAAALAMMSAQTARLAAPMLQQQSWTSWPETVIPFMLTIIAGTDRPQFSGQVNKLLSHARPEIRYGALASLYAINPGEVSESLPQMLNDSDPEVAVLARKTLSQINAESGYSSSRLLAMLPAGMRRLAEKWLKLPLTAQIGVPAFILLLMGLALSGGNPQTVTRVKVGSTAGVTQGTSRRQTEMQRFEHWQQPAEPGQERVVFGRIEENYSDSVLVQSPVLQAPVLVRHGKGLLPLRKNQHFNGRVKIDAVAETRIESTLLPTMEKNR